MALSALPQAVSRSTQNRILEKKFLATNGFEVAPYAVIHNPDNSHNLNGATSQAHPEQLSGLFPGILKVSRLGYDGKGQVLVSNAAELESAFASHEPGALRSGKTDAVGERNIGHRGARIQW